MLLGDSYAHLIGRDTLIPRGVNRFHVVNISRTTLDCAIDIRRSGINRRVHQLIRRATARGSINVVTHHGISGTTWRIPTQSDRMRAVNDVVSYDFRAGYIACCDGNRADSLGRTDGDRCGVCRGGRAWHCAIGRVVDCRSWRSIADSHRLRGRVSSCRNAERRCCRCDAVRRRGDRAVGVAGLDGYRFQSLGGGDGDRPGIYRR